MGNSKRSSANINVDDDGDGGLKVLYKRSKREEFWHIPNDILFSQILPRLPVKSLLKFKCVNKLWLSKISDPGFIVSNDRTQAVFMSTDKTHILFRFIDNQGFNRRHLWTRTITPVAVMDHSRNSKLYEYIAGSCNGLLLVVVASSLYLWNPSIKHISKVLELGLMHERIINATISGICYDSSINDYKVVMGFENEDVGSSIYSSSRGFVLVAGLKDKRWKQINFPYHQRPKAKRPRDVLYNGFLHWNVVELSKPDNHPCQTHNKIVAYDPKMDEFREVPLPRYKKRQQVKVLGLGILNSCLCMTCWDSKNIIPTTIEILAMKEYGKKESWTPLFDIWNFNGNPYYTILTPLLSMNNGGVIMMDGQGIFRYPQTMDFIVDEEVAKRSSSGYGGCGYSGAMLVESLASPIVYEWDEQQHQGLGKDILWAKT